MPVYVCKACEARNTASGRCILCNRSLGSLEMAVLAGVVSSALLGCAWVLLSLTGVIPMILGLFFGGLVSLAVVHFSAGRGLAYQAIASICTVAGMAVAGTAVVWLHWEKLTEVWGIAGTPCPPFWELLPMALQYDGLTSTLCVLGLAGGFWVWSPS